MAAPEKIVEYLEGRVPLSERSALVGTDIENQPPDGP